MVYRYNRGQDSKTGNSFYWTGPFSQEKWTNCQVLINPKPTAQTNGCINHYALALFHPAFAWEFRFVNLDNYQLYKEEKLPRENLLLWWLLVRGLGRLRVATNWFCNLLPHFIFPAQCHITNDILQSHRQKVQTMYLSGLVFFTAVFIIL